MIERPRMISGGGNVATLMASNAAPPSGRDRGAIFD
jgi:hypothetical protein